MLQYGLNVQCLLLPSNEMCNAQSDIGFGFQNINTYNIIEKLGNHHVHVKLLKK
jgi:hypothetical protein